MKNNPTQNLLKNVLTFLIIFLALNYLIGFFTGPATNQQQSNTINFYTDKKDFAIYDKVTATVHNGTEQNINYQQNCPSIQVYRNANWETSAIDQSECGPTSTTELKPGEKHQFQFKTNLFNELGTYKLSLPVDGKILESNQFEIKSKGFFAWVWETVLYQPIYNTLIFLTSVMPGHDLGLAIIILTIIIRTILLLPSQKALKSQKKLQEVQPLLAELKEKHANDQQRLAQETMAIYKEYKVNPLGSCLPLLIQIPILIALFYVVQNGLSPDTVHLLYGDLKNFDLSKINIMFLGILDLTKANLIALPLIVGLLQFIQMKLALPKTNPSGKKSEMEIMNKSMQIVMPIMIAIFTATAPAGVGLYWAFSTIYGIVQQYVVNRQKDNSATTIEIANQKNPRPTPPKNKDGDTITKIKI